MRRLGTLIATATLLFVVDGCKKTEDPAAESAAGKAAESEGEEAASRETQDEVSLVVYSGRGEPLISPALAAYEETSGVDLEVKYGDTAQLAGALLEEGAKSPADLFLAQDASTLGYLDQKKVFAELGADLLDKVPAGFKSSGGTWVGLSGRARVLAYNSDKLKESDLPKDVDALTDKKWKGRVGWAPENASFQSFVAAMIALRGKDATAKWLKAMKANEPVDYPKNTPAVIATSRGEVDVALVNHYYLYRLKEEHGEDFPVKNHYFRSGKAGALVNLSGGAVLASSKKQEEAQKLLAYLLSPEGQAHFVEGNHEFPVAEGAESPLDLPAASSLKAPEVDPAALENLEETVALLRETGVLR